MAKQVLTDRFLKALKPAPMGKRVDWMDAVVPGLGVRVTDKVDRDGKAAQRTFILTTRYPGSSNPTRRALGEYGAISLEDARNKAREWLGQIQRGIDPAEEAVRQRQATARQREIAKANTFGAVTEEFIRRHLSKQRRAAVSEREIRKELLTRWELRPIHEITRQDVIGMVDDIRDRGADRQAHNILGHARTIFNWTINRGTYGLESSPLDRMRPSTLIGAKNARHRVLNDDEIRAVWKGAGEMGYPYGPLCRLLMLTGQRKAEVAEAEWPEFDLDRRLWTVPAQRFKSGAAHIVPLSVDAVNLLRDLPRFNAGQHLFSTTAGKKPVNGFSKAKQRLDTLVIQKLAIESLERWVLHDIRRTVRTRLSALRVKYEVAEMVIGHARKGLQKVYDQHEYADEMREALEEWARLLRRIVEPRDNVVMLSASA